MLNNKLTAIFIAIFIPPAFAGSEYHAPHTANPLQFKMSVIDEHASGSYGLKGHDINQDGFTDLISFAYTGVSAGKIPGEIYWYEFQPQTSETLKPRWQKHLITKKKHTLSGAFLDVDHDGQDELVLISDFEVPVTNPDKEGNIWWAKPPKDLNANEWETYWIGQTAGAHRLVTPDLLGDGKKQVVVVPLFWQGKKPMYGPAAISLFEPNEDPKKPWKKTTFSNQKFSAMHDAIILPKTESDKSEKVLIAAQEGLVLLSFSKINNKWQMTSTILSKTPQDTHADLAARDKGVAPLNHQQKMDLSGITVLSYYQAENQQPIIAAIDYTKHSGFLTDEPWHGDTVSLYAPKSSNKTFASNNFLREILEKRTAGGHAVQVADLTGKGCPDVIAGFRSYPTALVVYQCNSKKLSDGTVQNFYTKQIISERSANAIVLGNWNKKGLQDFATVGYGEEGDPYILMWQNQG